MNDRQRKCAQALARGMTHAEACRAAGYKMQTPQAAGTHVGRLLKNAEFSAYLEQIREEAKKDTVADLQELLEFHTGGIRTPLSQVTRDSVYCAEESETNSKDASSYKLKKTSAIDHAKELARLLGLYAPEKHDLTVSDLRDIIARQRQKA